MIVTGPRRPTLVARGLTKVYRGGDVEVHALRGVDFALYERELAIFPRQQTAGLVVLVTVLLGTNVYDR